MSNIVFLATLGAAMMYIYLGAYDGAVIVTGCGMLSLYLIDRRKNRKRR